MIGKTQSEPTDSASGSRSDALPVRLTEDGGSVMSPTPILDTLDRFYQGELSYVQTLVQLERFSAPPWLTSDFIAFFNWLA